MPKIVRTIKLHLHANEETDAAFRNMTERYAQACNEISEYTFNNGLILNSNELQNRLYQTVRKKYGLKAQLAVSVFKTVTARYKTVETQLKQNPCRFRDGEKTYSFRRDLTWLQKPIVFSRPQADLVRNRDYSFVADGNGKRLISINTLDGRVKLEYDLPKCCQQYFMSDEWKLGTGKLVSLYGQWYLHISATCETDDTFDDAAPRHVVGIDRGLRFLATLYDEKGDTMFIDGREIMKKRDRFRQLRAELQARGTRSAKRALKRLSERENRWMSDVNHRITKTLVEKYGPDTLFVLEDLTGVSFSERNMNSRSSAGRSELRSWAFYQLEQYLSYKAEANGSGVIKVSAGYTSQRCPKCGRIHKENRHSDIHEYICDRCGYRSNDDRVAAMNIRLLGTMYVSGDENPRFGARRRSGK